MAVATTDKTQGITPTVIPSANFLSPQAAKDAILRIIRNVEWSPILDFGEIDIYVKKGKTSSIGVRYTII